MPPTFGIYGVRESIPGATTPFGFPRAVAVDPETGGAMACPNRAKRARAAAAKRGRKNPPKTESGKRARCDLCFVFFG